ncbi:uncharacterized protein LOC126366450 [Pectinophora gossypiella]|uniref:uncharacterized protein LOC126366450 n=1 Tax=Pectinophora gossypiella TaxID=13191 RepID=UPI00214F2F85|nr:uncharacterized protein LOC126366450 [Pectinophora gossypiella]
MKKPLLLGLCCVLFWCEEVLADIDNEVKRGVFPFLAVIYYPDDSVVDTTGARFQRAAVLIQPKWLISSSIDHSVLDNVPIGFPRKTLLARVGAITLDGNYTLNEDEDEQEREIIQVVRPSIHNAEVWWFTDITLLQTLLPFKMSSAVAVTSINPKREYIDKNCVILVYAKKYSNGTEDKTLMQLGVELLPPSIENCGTHFTDTTMTCAADSEETKNTAIDPEFCQGNSGGPLMCEGDVMALQTYIENNCKQPHLYQLLASWESFISCGTQEKCNVDHQCNICTVINKDQPAGETVPRTSPTTTTTTEVIYTTTPTIPETNADEMDYTTSPITYETDHHEDQTPPETSSTESPMTEMTTLIDKTEPLDNKPIPANATIESTTKESEGKSWPSERVVQSGRKMEDDVARKTKVEAQQQQVKTTTQVASLQHHSAAERKMSAIKIILTSIFVLACFI